VGELVAVAEAQRSKTARVTSSRSAAGRAALAVVTAHSSADKDNAASEHDRAQKDLADAEEDLRGSTVRRLAVYEHPGILEDAIANAKARLLIISRWIRRAVVDDSFLRAIRLACGRGVRVMIGFGLGEGDVSEKPWDAEARIALEKLAVAVVVADQPEADDREVTRRAQLPPRLRCDPLLG